MFFVVIRRESDNVLVALPLNKQFSGRMDHRFPVFQKILFGSFLFIDSSRRGLGI